MKSTLEEFMDELGKIQSLFKTFAQSVRYCDEYEKSTDHLITLSELIYKRMGKLHSNIEKSSWDL